MSIDKSYCGFIGHRRTSERWQIHIVEQTAGAENLHHFPQGADNSSPHCGDPY